MKRFALIALMVIPIVTVAQDFRKLERLGKKSKCYVIEQNEGYGLWNGTSIVEAANYYEYNFDGELVYFYSDAMSVCYDASGKKLIELPGGSLAAVECNAFIVGNKEEQLTLYTRTGIPILPLGKFEFDCYDNGIRVVNTENREEAFYDTKGTALVPFGAHAIVVDEYYNVIAVQDGEFYTVLLNGGLDLPMFATQLNDYTFVMDREVSIREYLVFLGNHKYEGWLASPETGESLPIESLFPDTNKVEAKLLPLYRDVLAQLADKRRFNEGTMNVNLSTESIALEVALEINKKYTDLLDYPVTGVSFEQAEWYCLWLRNIQSEYESEDYYEMIDYRLPTKEEWELIGKQGLRPENQTKMMPDSLNKENCMLFVFQSAQQCKNYGSYLKSSKGGGSVPVTTKTYDMSGRTNVYGNVAEMTNQQGIAKGGSFAQPAEVAKYTNDIFYTGPESWLGFRIVGQYKLW